MPQSGTLQLSTAAAQLPITLVCRSTNREVRIFSLSLAISANKGARRCVSCLGPCPEDYWLNSTPFWPLALVCRSTNREVRIYSLSLAILANKRARRCVSCLGPCPVDSWSNSTSFWPLTLVCRSNNKEVRIAWHLVPRSRTLQLSTAAAQPQ